MRRQVLGYSGIQALSHRERCGHTTFEYPEIGTLKLRTSPQNK